MKNKETKNKDQKSNEQKQPKGIQYCTNCETWVKCATFNPLILLTILLFWLFPFIIIGYTIYILKNQKCPHCKLPLKKGFDYSQHKKERELEHLSHNQTIIHGESFAERKGINDADKFHSMNKDKKIEELEYSEFLKKQKDGQK